jgi:hypothetical protein
MPASSTISFGIFLFLMVLMVTVHLTILDFKPVNAQKPEILIGSTNADEKNNLVVMAKINLQNIDKKGIIKVVGVINGEDFVKNIPLDTLKDSTKKLKVTFSMNKDNEINSAHKPDEFFVCAYHVKNPNNMKSVSFDKQNDVTIDYFDCNEGDIQSTTSPTESSLFKAKSQVFNKTATYYNMYSKPKMVSFDTLGNDTIESTTNNLSNNNGKQDNKKSSIIKEDNNSNKPVQVKIIVPMDDKKNAKKIKIMAMLKGQVKSAMVDVQKEFDKIGGYTIERTFAFDRNTDMGPIQIGDRFHTCVIGQDLNPPEGSECEKRLIKHLDKPNTLAAR